ncbi:MAG: SsrA-binding protein SmpB [Alphaproteobacteria bacterium]|nr:SsrA-binding protein SmpB [Alphaproteobacteria bacterium]
MAQKASKQVLITENRKARYHYEIIDSFEVGIQLQGTEVKALREGKSSIADSYASPENNDIFLINAWIPEYSKANRSTHGERRPRKLLLHRREINKLSRAVQRSGMSLVPLKLYFNIRGIAKLELALARGKKLFDKREVEKKRDWQISKARLLREKG